VQVVFVRTSGVTAAALTLPDVDAAGSANGAQQSRLSGSVFSREKGDGRIKGQMRRLFDKGAIEGIKIGIRVALNLEQDIFKMRHYKPSEADNWQTSGNGQEGKQGHTFHNHGLVTRDKG
jgi:hypothetical protein